MLTVYVYKSIGQFNVKYILTVHVCAIMQVHECLRSMSFYSVYTAQCDQISTCIMIWYAYFSTEDKNGPPNALLLDHQLHRAPWKPLFSVRLPVRLERTPLLSRQDFQEESTKRFVSLFFGSGKLVFIGTFWTSRPEHFQTFSDTMSCLSYFRNCTLRHNRLIASLSVITDVFVPRWVGGNKIMSTKMVEHFTHKACVTPPPRRAFELHQSQCTHERSLSTCRWLEAIQV